MRSRENEKNLGGTPKPRDEEVDHSTTGIDPWTGIRKRLGAFLPHWTREGATYGVTFRLGDSLPRSVLEGWKREREKIVARVVESGRELSEVEARRLDQLHSERVNRFLDAGHGECVLRRPEAAAIVRDAVLHFDGTRYDLFVWCVMPNHVHVVVRPRDGFELAVILHSWKSFTSHAINKVLGRRGELWQQEYFDHLIRDEMDFERCVKYVLENPEKAGLRGWEWVGVGGVKKKE